MELAKKYDFEAIEKKHQEFWEKNNIFKFDINSNKPIYSIDVPPPYASAGHLHVGHVLHYTQFEMIGRQRRMVGYNVYFAPCFDNNGLPTEKYVEEKFKISKKDTTRSEFRKLCLEESRKVEKAYADRFFKKLGHSYDWSLLYTTIDPEAQKVAQWSFLDLYEKGDMYRAEEPVLWCPYHQTALAQAEVENIDRTTTLNHVLFDLKDSDEKIEIATSRPELLASCVGVFIHPEDKRHKHLVGKKAIVPLFGYEVDVMQDEKVDMEFGTGIVMVCTFGDTADIEWWKKYKLPLKISITEDGKLNEVAGKYKGLTIKEAKEGIIKDLEKEKRVVKKESLQQSVGTCWRCNNPVEFIVTKQWFIKTLKYKNELVAQGRKIKWFPDHMRVRYEDWTNNLAWDWCVSRQRFYGVPIPVWYCKNCGKIILPEKEELPIDPSVDKPKQKCDCGSEEFIAELDVFDTWMTSSCTPEIASRFLEKPELFKKLFPMSLRPQSHDIIRTWAFYTILKAYLHFKEIPWKDIAIGTYVLDPKGRGMHKSKGNAVWFEDLYNQFKSIDVIRYWVGTANFGEDLPFKEKELVAGKRFLTKIWNGARFAIIHLSDFNPGQKVSVVNVIDKAMISMINNIVKKSKELYEVYKVADAKKLVEVFFWHTFCDNYLEMIKDRLYNPNKYGSEERLSAQSTLYFVLLNVLKLISPITPHVTEEIYQLYFKQFEKTESIHLTQWPDYKEEFNDEKAELSFSVAVDVISTVRKYKSDNKLSLKVPLKRLVIKCEKQEHREALLKVIEDIKAVTHAQAIVFGKEVSIPCSNYPVKLGIELGEVEKK